MTTAAPWLLKINTLSRAYGDCEGLVCREASSGHPLEWFAPDFLSHAGDWRRAPFASVAIAALALHLERFEAQPIVITSGPRIKEAKEELRREGKHKEAARLKRVTFSTKEMRTVFSSTRDHAEIIGKVLERRKITLQTWKKLEGWLLEVEVLPDQLPTGYVLPVYVFPAALGRGYIPKRGELVQGRVWLQGSFLHKAKPEEVERFEAQRQWKPADEE